MVPKLTATQAADNTKNWTSHEQMHSTVHVGTVRSLHSNLYIPTTPSTIHEKTNPAQLTSATTQNQNVKYHQVPRPRPNLRLSQFILIKSDRQQDPDNTANDAIKQVNSRDLFQVSTSCRFLGLFWRRVARGEDQEKRLLVTVAV
ncbi:hypothetical protein BD289DRAFT_443553 [Coniella lustricola]|uniref:Uncharacterized protein n=1 Tax=Coniella lustricola TaxID=2025994 RepID=A0A2T2ZWZ8_9PEZI|nr:hypothetical protein BD289DRAFT_443553 [Coniella lustricola]